MPGSAAEPTDASRVVERPHGLRRLAVIVGITEYAEPRLRLQSPVRDAEALGDLLARDHGYEVWLRRDSEATRQGLVRLFEEELAAAVDDETSVLVYFAGHGTAVDAVERPRGYLVPADGTDAIDSLWPMEELSRALDRLRCRHLILLLDCCFAGAFRWSAGRDVVLATLPDMYQERYQLFLATPAWQVITSAAYDEQAADVVAGLTIGRRDAGQPHSPFLRALLLGLAGAADFFPRRGPDDLPGDGVITATELYLYLREALEPVARQTPGLWTLPKHRKGEYVFHVPGTTPRLASAPALARASSPYRGFEVYQEEHAAMFHGRRVATDALRRQVEAQPITVVVGGSGTGKSSLVRAGLVPALRAHHADWQILAPIRPGATPQATLDAALAGRAPGPAVLIVDQLEELFAGTDRQAERVRFLERLVAASASGDLRVVGTLRADLETELWSSPLAKGWAHARFPLGDMNRDELREAIEIPAERMVLTFDPPTLVDRLVDTVVSMPGALPLLSFTLDKLYLDCLTRANGDRRLVDADETGVGGIAVALRDHADRLHGQFDEATRATMRRIMLRMISLKGGSISRRQVPLAELEFADPAERARVQRVTDALTDPGNQSLRLVVQGGDEHGGFVELAHDAVARDWPRFRAWQREARQEDLLLHRTLTAAATQWAADGKHAGLLWRDDPRLPLVSSRLAATPHLLNRIEAEFVRRSRRARRRRTGFVVGATVVFVTVVSTLALLARNRATAEAEARVLAEDNALAEQGGRAGALALTPGREVDALVLAVEATGKSRARARPIPPAVVNGLAAAVGTPAHPIAILTSTRASAMKTAAFSPDGALVVTAGAGGEALVFDTATGAFRAELKDADGGELVGASFSPDGRRVLTWSKDKTAKIWDVASGQRVVTLAGHTGTVWAAAFSPDGARVLTGDGDGRVALWDATTGAEVGRFVGHEAGVERAIFSADGTQILTTGDDHTARLWNAATGASSVVLRGHEGPVAAAAFSPDGRYAVTGDTVGSVRLWRTSTGEQVAALTGHTGLVRSVAFSPDGTRIVTTSDDTTASIWDSQTHERHVLAGHTGMIASAAFSPDGTRVITASTDQTARIWDASSGAVLAVLAGHLGVVVSASFAPDGKSAVTASWDKSARLWAISADALPRVLAGHDGQVLEAAFDPGGDRIVTASAGGTATIWDARGGEARVTYRGHTAAVRSAMFSPDGARVVTASDDGTARIWDARTGATLTALAVGTKSPRAVWSPDGTRVASISADAAGILWGTDGTRLHALGVDSLANSVAFSPDGARIMTASTGGEVALWRADGVLEASGVAPPPLFGAALSPDGTRLLVASDQTALVYAVDGLRLQSLLTGHRGYVTSGAFSPDGTRVVTAGSDYTVRVWDAADGAPRFTLGGLTAFAASFSPDGTQILVRGAGPEVALYPVSMEGLLPIACRLLRLHPEFERVRAYCPAP